MKPRLLDLFCGAGGAAMGYHRAGFEVVGVDIEPQKNYPFEFHQADAMTFPLDGFDAIHASPPCQGYSVMRHLPWNRDREYPMLIADVRRMLVASGTPFVIENVEGARRHMDGGWLCGTMFSLPFYRHRIFETNFFWLQPGHPRHEWRIRGGHTLAGRARQVGFTERYTKAGRPAFGFDKVGSAIGHGAGAVLAREAMGIEWMTRDESTQAIPPQFTEYIGKQLLAALVMP
jgi:DNA (cytosine-5)-methyltransferase 1